MRKDEVTPLREAYENGKQIQELESGTTDTWVNGDVMKKGLCVDSTYRIKPEESEKYKL